MKDLTPYLIRFSIVAAVSTVAFRYFLSYGIENNSAEVIIFAATLYGVALFTVGWYFGRNDARHLPILDVGFRFHLMTYLVHIVISELWFLAKMNSSLESAQTVHLTALYWGIFVLIHFILFRLARRKSIRGLDKTELFE
ncbi:hypothetical protein [Parapedobacter tibetensis]|uniref:hypothetical protein n=1 Tax=Parapedobacter tibetensis TaxID=2972951 RepID=UPI00214DE478|nr:hypothetical protein [Parapedobacter tibetensis]